MRPALALQVPLNDAPVVKPVDDPDAFDDAACSIYAAGEPDIIDMIEEERCESSPCGAHIYIARNHCNYCNTPAPWLRRDACRLP